MECESWDYKKKAERWRIDAFELWCWRRLLRVPWTAMRSNQFILKEISSEYSLEGLMLKLKLQNFGHLMQKLTHLKTPWCWERLKVEGHDRGWDGWMASPTRWTWVWVNSGSWWWTGRPGVLQFMGLQQVGHDWATELNWDLKFFLIFQTFRDIILSSIQGRCVCVCVCVCSVVFDSSRSHELCLPGSSVHGILQARIQERIAISSCRGPFRPRNQICNSCISCIGRRILYHCAPWEAPHTWQLYSF